MNALVIDDSRTMRTVIGNMLESLGFEVAEAGNGLEAMEHLRQFGPPNVVLVDWNMPVMDGLSFIKEVRAVEEFSELPVMMVTTEIEMQRIALAYLAGVSEYVMKPFDQPTIHDKLRLLGVIN
ncbi:response regulator [Pirellulaceae bacterium SH449]